MRAGTARKSSGSIELSKWRDANCPFPVNKCDIPHHKRFLEDFFQIFSFRKKWKKKKKNYFFFINFFILFLFVDIGSWGISTHHRYNTEANILHRGDGSNVYLSQGVLVTQPVAGTGQMRSVVCKDANCGASTASGADLLAPVALATAPDGSLYVGDFNLIRRISPGGNIATVLQLP